MAAVAFETLGDDTPESVPATRGGSITKQLMRSATTGIDVVNAIRTGTMMRGPSFMLATEEQIADALKTEEVVNGKQKPRTLFALQINSATLPSFVNPRETVASRILSDRGVQIVGNLFLRNNLVVTFLIGVSFCLDIVGIIGVIPEFGYLGIPGIGAVGLLVLHLNVRLLRMLASSFECWGLCILSVIAVGGLMDCVSHSPPRIVALTSVFANMLSVNFFDARIFAQKWNTKVSYLISLLAVTAKPWVIVLLWFTGQFRDINETTVEVGVITVNVQSVAMNAYMTFTVLITKYLLVLIMNREETNKLLVAKPLGWYKHIQADDVKAQEAITVYEAESALSRGPAPLASPRKTRVPLMKGSSFTVPDENEIVRVKKLTKKLGRTYALQINANSIPLLVNPRHTIASKILPRFLLYPAFVLYKEINFVLVLLMAICTPTALVGVTGHVPELGYAGLGMLPLTLIYLLHFNVDLAKALIMTFEYCGVVALIVISIAGLMDSVWGSAPRVIALLCFGLSMIVTSATDAKMPVKKRHKNLVMVNIFAVIISWALIILWYSGRFVDVTQRIVTVGTISIDFQSTAISSMITYAVLMTKYLIVLFATRKESNVLLVIKPRAWYKYLDGEGKARRNRRSSLTGNRRSSLTSEQDPESSQATITPKSTESLSPMKSSPGE